MNGQRYKQKKYICKTFTNSFIINQIKNEKNYLLIRLDFEMFELDAGSENKKPCDRDSLTVIQHKKESRSGYTRGKKGLGPLCSPPVIIYTPIFPCFWKFTHSPTLKSAQQLPPSIYLPTTQFFSSTPGWNFFTLIYTLSQKELSIRRLWMKILSNLTQILKQVFLS